MTGDCRPFLRRLHKEALKYRPAPAPEGSGDQTEPRLNVIDMGQVEWMLETRAPQQTLERIHEATDALKYATSRLEHPEDAIRIATAALALGDALLSRDPDAVTTAASAVIRLGTPED